MQVRIGIVIGAVTGYLEPHFDELQPLADGFIKMLPAPIILGIVVVSIAKMGSIKEVGRIDLKGLIYIMAVASIVGELMDAADPPRNVVFTSSWHNFSTLS